MELVTGRLYLHPIYGVVMALALDLQIIAMEDTEWFKIGDSLTLDFLTVKNLEPYYGEMTLKNIGVAGRASCRSSVRF